MAKSTRNAAAMKDLENVCQLNWRLVWQNVLWVQYRELRVRL